VTATAGEYAAVLTACVKATLQRDEHWGCDYRDQSEYYPAEDGQKATVACGCGLAFDAEPLTVLEPTTVPASSQVAVQPAVDPVYTVLATIDPTQVYTPEQVEARILDCVARLEFGGAFEREIITTAYAAKQAYEMAAAKAHVLRIGEGSEKDRMALALVDTEELFNAMTQAEMMRKAVYQTMHNLRAVLNGYQSVLKSINGSLPYGGSPGPGGRR
jgi:hypothetical protein